MKHLRETAGQHTFLFADVATIVLKAPDDLQALVANRISAHEQAEKLRLEAERERIRAEEVARLQREADAKAAREAAEVVRLQHEAEAKIAADVTAPVATPAPAPVAAHVCAAITTDSGARLTLGQINERIAPLSITAAGLDELGFNCAEQSKYARLYRESDFSAICTAIVRHIQNVQTN